MRKWTEYLKQLIKTQTDFLEKQEAIEAEEIKSGKALGRDSVPSKMIKYMGVEGIKQMKYHLNKIMKSGRILKEWTKGIILITYKGGDKRNCNNYSGII